MSNPIMQDSKRKKAVLIVCLILCILGMVVVGKLSSLNSTPNESSEIDPLRKETSPVPKFQESSSEWIQGETVKVVHEFNPIGIDLGASYWGETPYYQADSYHSITSPTRATVSDTYDAVWRVKTLEESETIFDSYYFIIDVGEFAPRKGKLIVDMDRSIERGSWQTNYPWIYFEDPDNPLDYVSYYPGVTGYQEYDGQTYMSSDGIFFIQAWLYFTSNSVDEDHLAVLAVDCLAYQAADLIENLRTEYRYTSNPSVTEHKVSVWNPITSNLTITLPDDWSLSSITPSYEYTIDGNNNLTVINAPGNTAFTFLFSCSLSKQYLAIEDKTSDYLEDIGFEGSWSNDWENHSSSGWDEISLNSTIVSEGAFSLRLSDSTSSSHYFSAGDWQTGYYYISFDYYFESITGDFWIQWADETTMDAIQIMDETTSRWHRFFAFVHLKVGSYDFFRFKGTSFTGVVFLDDFEIWEVNHQVETSGYREFSVSGQMINWDGYSNPSVDSETVNLELRDRTADSSIISTTKITDSNGNFDWVVNTPSYNELQDQREIEVQSCSYKSRFGFNSLEYFEDLSIVSGYSTLTYSESIEDNALKFEISDNTWFGISFDSLIDVSDCDFLSYKVKANQTSSSSTDIYYHYLRAPDSSNIYDYSIDFSYTTAYSTVIIPVEDLNINTGNPDLSTLNTFRIYFNEGGGITNITIYLDEIYWIQAQKSYFTPMKTTDFPYYYDSVSNEWDWSEGAAFDGVSVYYNTNNEAQKDGYSQFMADSGQNHLYLRFFPISLDTSEYNYLYIRINQNTSETMVCRAFLDGGGSFRQITPLIYFSDSWTTFSIDLTTDPDWTGVASYFYLYIYDLAWSNFEGDEQIQIDFIRITYQDSPSLWSTESYAYLGSLNNSFGYRIEIDSQLQGYTSDLGLFLMNISLGTHEINATPYVDLDRSGVFLPGPSVTGAYKAEEILYYLVHFSFVDGVGLGLPFETFKLFVNGSRIYDEEILIRESSVLNVSVTDYFNVSLFQQNYTISKDNYEIAIVIDVFEVIFRNNNTIFDSELIITRNNTVLNITATSSSEFIHRFTEGVYNITVYMIVIDSSSYTNVEEGKTLLFEEDITFSKKLEALNPGETIIDVGGPEPKLKWWEQFKRDYMSLGFLVGIAFSGSVALVMREVWFVVKAEGFKKGTQDALVTPDSLEAKQTRLDYEEQREHLRETKK
jgi:hypothetical protein